jgi:predicted TIM-barrel fold metal-dependent hydrolase
MTTIFDSHAHLKHGDAEHTEYKPEQIIATMDAVGISKSVVFAMSTTATRAIDMAEQAVAQYPDRLVPYVYALPRFDRPIVDELDDALDKRSFRGIKIHAGECSLQPYVIDTVLHLAGRYDVPCLVDCGGRLGEMAGMLKRYPNTKCIIAHLGRYLCEDADLIDRFIDLAEECDNAYLDVSGVVLTQKIKEATERIGSARVIWGTDGPHLAPDTAGFARAEIEKVTALHLAPEVERDVLGGSIARLLKVEL